jgi:hypothetical protein
VHPGGIAKRAFASEWGGAVRAQVSHSAEAMKLLILGTRNRIVRRITCLGESLGTLRALLVLAGFACAPCVVLVSAVPGLGLGAAACSNVGAEVPTVRTGR